LYGDGVRDVGDLQVSRRGQMSLPASARHRWGLGEGGSVGYVDLGDIVVLVPGGTDRLRADLLGQLTDEDRDDARSGFGDPDLADM
jgi:bifunctional DNA-binding transcriptional regulator/antitoxin component of YhaV-PrlF toxin-antitoxin module